jgi:hypothetical protein
MTAKWGCLTTLAIAAAAWNVVVWTTDDPPDTGFPCILVLGLLALAVIYIGAAIEKGTKIEPRGFPIEPRPPDREA